jgi:hypothetical protein
MREIASPRRARHIAACWPIACDGSPSMNKLNGKKLNLSRSTVKKLADDTLSSAAGGGNGLTLFACSYRCSIGPGDCTPSKPADQ